VEVKRAGLGVGIGIERGGIQVQGTCRHRLVRLLGLTRTHVGGRLEGVRLVLVEIGGRVLLEGVVPVVGLLRHEWLGRCAGVVLCVLLLLWVELLLRLVLLIRVAGLLLHPCWLSILIKLVLLLLLLLLLGVVWRRRSESLGGERLPGGSVVESGSGVGEGHELGLAADFVGAWLLLICSRHVCSGLLILAFLGLLLLLLLLVRLFGLHVEMGLVDGSH